MEPVLPESMMILRRQIGLEGSIKWADISSSMLSVGNHYGQLPYYFKKIEDASIQLELDKLQNSLKNQSSKPKVEYHLEKIYSI